MQRCQDLWGRSKEVLCVSGTKEPTYMIFHVADRMRAFALGDKGRFDQAVEGRQRTIELLDVALCGVRTVQDRR